MARLAAGCACVNVCGLPRAKPEPRRTRRTRREAKCESRSARGRRLALRIVRPRRPVAVARASASPDFAESDKKRSPATGALEEPDTLTSSSSVLSVFSVVRSSALVLALVVALACPDVAAIEYAELAKYWT